MVSSGKSKGAGSRPNVTTGFPQQLFRTSARMGDGIDGWVINKNQKNFADISQVT